MPRFLFLIYPWLWFLPPWRLSSFFSPSARCLPLFFSCKGLLFKSAHCFIVFFISSLHAGPRPRAISLCLRSKCIFSPQVLMYEPPVSLFFSTGWIRLTSGEHPSSLLFFQSTFSFSHSGSSKAGSSRPRAVFFGRVFSDPSFISAIVLSLPHSADTFFAKEHGPPLPRTDRAFCLFPLRRLPFSFSYSIRRTFSFSPLNQLDVVFFTMSRIPLLSFFPPISGLEW